MYKVIGVERKEYGPISGDQIRQWIAEGRVTGKNQACSEGTSTWTPLEILPEFAGCFRPPISSSARPPAGGGINVIIPYRNPLALTAYYSAVFALIPFLGIVLGLLAFVLGILGLRTHRRNPQAGGVVHAWIGIILGGLCGFGYLALTAWLVSLAMTNKH